MKAPTNVSIQRAAERAVKGLADSPNADSYSVVAGQRLTAAGVPGTRKGFELTIVAHRVDEAKPSELVVFVADPNKPEAVAEEQKVEAVKKKAKPVSVKKEEAPPKPAKKAAAKKTVAKKVAPVAKKAAKKAAKKSK